jgi:hypothetical protein
MKFRPAQKFAVLVGRRCVVGGSAGDGAGPAFFNRHSGRHSELGGVRTPQGLVGIISIVAFVIDRRLIAERGVATMGIVPALDEVKDRHPCLNPSFETAALEQLAFQGGEKAFRHRVVETIADRTH